jgi:hypothetical protein
VLNLAASAFRARARRGWNKWTEQCRSETAPRRVAPQFPCTCEVPPTAATDGAPACAGERHLVAVALQLDPKSAQHLISHRRPGSVDIYFTKRVVRSCRWSGARVEIGAKWNCNEVLLPRPRPAMHLRSRHIVDKVNGYAYLFDIKGARRGGGKVPTPRCATAHWPGRRFEFESTNTPALLRDAQFMQA